MCDYMDTMWLLFMVITTMSDILICGAGLMGLLYRPFYGPVFINIGHDTDRFLIRHILFLRQILSFPGHDTDFMRLRL